MSTLNLRGFQLKEMMEELTLKQVTEAIEIIWSKLDRVNDRTKKQTIEIREIKAELKKYANTTG